MMTTRSPEAPYEEEVPLSRSVVHKADHKTSKFGYPQHESDPQTEELIRALRTNDLAGYAQSEKPE